MGNIRSQAINDKNYLTIRNELMKQFSFNEENAVSGTLEFPPLIVNEIACEINVDETINSLNDSSKTFDANSIEKVLSNCVEYVNAVSRRLQTELPSDILLGVPYYIKKKRGSTNLLTARSAVICILQLTTI